MTTSDPSHFVTRSPEETEALGARLAPMLSAGTVLALFGDLAAGKTCFVRGLARHFGAGDTVHSPTFTLVNEYGTTPKLFHFDLYRLGSPEELADLGLEEMLDAGVCAIEWAERAEDLLPKRRVEIRFRHAGHDQREIDIRDWGVLPESWSDQMAATARV